ncbi:MAG: Formimidoylglutamase [Fimbriimonadaceae bacterium]|nr:Formimidoylglutamase [Fimbriimonadaceae bacterium]
MAHNDPNWPRASEWLKSGGHDVAILGVPLNHSISPGRCDLAPAAIREALHFYSPFDVDQGTTIPSPEDLGDLKVSSHGPEDAFPIIVDRLQDLRKANRRIILLGGDNGVTRPGVHGLGLPLEKCGLITLDAHLDLRDTTNGLHNGNPVRALLEDGMPGKNIIQIGIQSFANSEPYYKVALESGIEVCPRSNLSDFLVTAMVDEVMFWLPGDVEAVYLDIDLDVMDRAFAPGCPGSRPGGLTPSELRTAIRLICDDARVVIADIVELDPERDLNNVTALAGAACLLEVASAWGHLNSRP